MLKAADNPPVQSPALLPLEEFQGRWWVSHTKPRQEKALAWDLHRLDLGYFLPMYDITRQSRGRKWVAKLVLFPGYLFLCCDEDGRVKALQTGRIAGMIEVVNQKQLILELSAVKRLVETQFAVDPYPALKEGTLCRVRSGPLAGMEGRVDRRKNPTRLVIQVSILGQGAAVEIDAELLEPLD
jgi:transcription antitermination factor NusG